MGKLEQTECPECGQIVHYQPQRWKAQVVCSNCQTGFAVEASQPPALPRKPASPVPSHLQSPAEPEERVPEPAPPAQPSERVRYQRSKIGGLVTVSIVTVALVAIVGGGFWGLALMDSKRTENAREEAAKKLAENIQYILAGKKRARLGNMEVSVEGAEYGPLRVKGQSNRVQVSSDPMLQIFLEIRSRRPRAVNYVSWYGNTFPRGSEQVVAQLRDEQGVVFNMPVFEGVKGLFGHTSEAVIENNQRIQDCLVFELPADMPITDLKDLFLSLPMECFGDRNRSTIYFRIPREMIQVVGDEAGQQ